MNHLTLIEEIIKKLEKIDKFDLAKEVLEVESAAATGGELISSVCSKLLEFKVKYPTVYLEISSEVNKLIEYANSFGIYQK